MFHLELSIFGSPQIFVLLSKKTCSHRLSARSIKHVVTISPTLYIHKTQFLKCCSTKVWSLSWSAATCKIWWTSTYAMIVWSLFTFFFIFYLDFQRFKCRSDAFQLLANKGKNSILKLDNRWLYLSKCWNLEYLFILTLLLESVYNWIITWMSFLSCEVKDLNVHQLRSKTACSKWQEMRYMHVETICITHYQQKW